MAEQLGANREEAEVTKGVATDATKPSAASQDPIKENEASRMEIILASLLIPAKGDSTGADQRSLEAAVQQSKAPP